MLMIQQLKLLFAILIILLFAKRVTAAICKEEDDTYLGGLDPTRRNRLEDVRVRQYNGITLCNYTEVCLQDTFLLLNEPYFSKNKTTLFYMHGYNENPLRPSSRGITRAYLKRNDTNFLIVNWTNMAFWPYFLNAIPNCKTVAEEVSKILIDLFRKEEIDISTFHLMGHSLGGYCVAILAHRLKDAGYFVPRMTVLDPVGFGLDRNSNFKLYLNKDAAKFVDAIHTNAGIVGTVWNIGTVDFWPNGGFIQPGCIESFHFNNAIQDFYCSHRRSWEFWIESMVNPIAFRASEMSRCNRLSANYCSNDSDSIPVYMGMYVDQRLEGAYYLTTNKSPPYGKGENGVCKCV